MTKLYISKTAANILLKTAQDPSFLIDRDGWNQTDVEDLCWALTNRDEDNRITLTAKQFTFFYEEADSAICESERLK